MALDSNSTTSTLAFMQTRQVFSLEEARSALKPEGSAQAMKERLRYYVRTRRLSPVTRGVYAAVPLGLDADRFRPDPFLVAATVRADAVFAFYSALSLLGAARVDWNVVTVVTSRRRGPLEVAGVRLDFLSVPPTLARLHKQGVGLRSVDRLGRPLRVTGPERTLVEGFRELGRVGGVGEFVDGAASFPVLDLDLVERFLRAFDEKVLWAAVGWFLERHQESFSVPNTYLARLERRRPRARVYLARREGRGRLASRWNLLLPERVTRSEEPNER
jgi:predicted transcriptional regulator of viral defense system